MKLFTYGLMIFTLVFTSCSKDGDVGPIGPAGTAGVDGIAGTNGSDGTEGVDGTDGEDGNANIRIIEYSTKTFTSSTTYVMDNVSAADVDSHLILAYYGRTFNEIAPNGGILEKTQWLPVPGRGENDLFTTSSVIESSSFANNSDYIVGLYNLDGTQYAAARTFRMFKIFIAPPSSFSGKSSKSNLSKMSYKEVIAHFGIEE